MERRGLAELEEGVEAEELESNKFSALELAPLVTDASKPTPCVPISACLGLAGAAPKDVAEVVFLSCLGDAVFFFLLRDGDLDLVFELPPPPIITDDCSRPRAFLNNAGLSLLIFSPLLSPTSLLATATGRDAENTQLLTRAGEGFCTLGGGSGFGFFWTPAGKLG